MIAKSHLKNPKLRKQQGQRSNAAAGAPARIRAPKTIINFKVKGIKRDGKGYYIMMKGSIKQREIMITMHMPQMSRCFSHSDNRTGGLQ